MREWWRHFVSMPDRERARLLSLVFGAIIVGILYALGGISLYLRTTFLGAPTPMQQGLAPALTPLPPLIIITPTQALSPTLYPTITPTKPQEAPASSSALFPLEPSATPFPSPTAQPTHTPEPSATMAGPERPGR